MRSRILSSLAIAALAAAPLVAQGSMAATAAAPAKPAPPPAGFRGEFAKNFAAVSDKYLQLAQAIPADKYSWRPAPGVRSIAETFLHAAAAQYLMGSTMGWPTPAGIALKGMPDMMAFETSTTDKAKIIETLKAAFAYMNAGVMAMPDASSDKTVVFFGQTMTMREMLFAETAHNGEHLGQMIAYARMNNVVPPWSMKAAAGM